jgi:glutamate synthase (ferredoxin)
MNELIGHVELLHQTSALERINEKAKTVDLQGLLYQPTAVDSAKERYFTQPQDHALWKTLDQSTLISLCEGAIKNLGEKADYSLGITNRNRTVGCMLSAEIVRRHGPSGLPDGSVHLRFEGSAGLSFGAFLTKGVEMELHGDANDYLAKGLSGGRIVVVPPDGSTFEPSENIIIGNVALYGATSGEVYIRGIAGERFCVRNSGATAVSEGVGNHCCEYMTGGTVVVLGETGRNFAAGMSGGVAYVLDEAEDLESHVNKGMVSVKPLDNHDEKELKAILKQYAQCTGSDVAKKILKNFKAQKHTIKKVIPDAYDALIAERRNHG